MINCRNCGKRISHREELIPGFCSLTCSDEKSEQKWKGVKRPQKTNVEQSLTIRQFLDRLGLGEYTPLFEENAITVPLLSTLTSEDLRELGVTALGHRKQILNSVSEPHSPNSSHVFSTAPTPYYDRSMDLVPEHPVPTGLISATWIVTGFSFLPIWTLQIAFFVSLAILILAVMLACHPNSTAKINGWVILALWGISFLIGYMNPSIIYY